MERFFKLFLLNRKFNKFIILDKFILIDLNSFDSFIDCTNYLISFIIEFVKISNLSQNSKVSLKLEFYSRSIKLDTLILYPYINIAKIMNFFFEIHKTRYILLKIS